MVDEAVPMGSVCQFPRLHVYNLRGEARRIEEPEGLSRLLGKRRTWLIIFRMVIDGEWC